MRVAGFVPASLVDWPGRLCATIFLAGCDLRCPFCHNPQLVRGRGEDLALEPVLAAVAARPIRHVCVSGGEPTLHPDLGSLLRALRELGCAVKLDTHGGHPERLEAVVDLCDYVAMDVKTRWERYAEVGAPSPLPFQRSVDLIRRRARDYEFRTTAVPGLVEEEDARAIAAALHGARRWVLQQFRPQPPLLDPAWETRRPHPGPVLRRWAEELRAHFELPVGLRGVGEE
jgi:pyruvate formate lyase activating enzyme